MLRRSALPAAGLAAAALALSACSSTAGAGSAASVAVASADGACTVTPTSVPAGPVTFTVTNGGSGVTELYVYAADGTTILSEVENVGPGTSRDLVVELTAGGAVVGCRPDDASDAVVTPITVTASGATASSSAAAELEAAVAQYRAYVATETAALLAGTKEFVAAVKDGDVEKAKSLYPQTRVHWERIEPVAESFADLDAAMDARDGDLDPGTEWTGWHRIEKALWVDATLEGMAPVADKLLTDTEDLVGRIATIEITTSLLGNGAAALLEEVATGKVTGEEERYSRTDLWDFDANVDGARAAFDALTPALLKVDGELHGTIESRFDALDAALAQHADGEGFVGYDELTPEQVRALADKVDALAEPLSNVTAALVSR